MSLTAEQVWQEANQRYLSAALARVKGYLEGRVAGEEARAIQAESQAPDDVLFPDPPSALRSLQELFGLSAFERDLLLLCAGPELDGSMPYRQATFSLALATFPGAHWSALTPVAPLRWWHLILVGRGETLLGSPLSIDERILHHLTGSAYLDQRLQPSARLLTPDELPPSQAAVAAEMAALWSRREGTPLVQLCGPDVAAKQAIAAVAGDTLGIMVYAVRAVDLPVSSGERDLIQRLWERESALTGCVIALDCEEQSGEELRLAEAFAARYGGPLVILAREPVRLTRREFLRIDIARPLPAEQRALWASMLGENNGVEELTAHFNLSLSSMRNAVAAVRESGDLWEACRRQARPRLDDLAQRVEPDAEWADLILPEPQLAILRELLLHVRHRATVYGEWGFGRRGARGLGISALFAGGSGTGKTLAAEVLAGELRLDLYRIDLSQVVSKYIGETEKNLRRVFDAAEEAGAILLFDEADALFGKRSEVKDSHDRYANIEVGYLLQRMEAYHGLSILTTNLKSALDPAFLRRIRFVVQFPFPEEPERAAIWRRIFPPGTPLGEMRWERLAQLNVAGGSIRNIALGAAFLAAGEGEPVSMAHLLAAARTEYAKLERQLTPAETRGWL